MKLLYDKDYIEQTLAEQIVLVDASFLIDLSQDKGRTLREYLEILRNANCELITTDLVIKEFARGAKTIRTYRSFESLVGELQIQPLSLRAELLNKPKFEQFFVAYNHTANRPSVTDAELATVVYYFSEAQKIFLLTANYKDMPEGLLHRDSFIAYDMNGQIRSHGIYRLADKKILDRTLKKFE